MSNGLQTEDTIQQIVGPLPITIQMGSLGSVILVRQVECEADNVERNAELGWKNQDQAARLVGLESIVCPLARLFVCLFARSFHSNFQHLSFTNNMASGR